RLCPVSDQARAAAQYVAKGQKRKSPASLRQSVRCGPDAFSRSHSGITMVEAAAQRAGPSRTRWSRKNRTTLALNSRWNAVLSKPAGASVQILGIAAASCGEHGARKAKWPAGTEWISGFPGRLRPMRAVA